MGGMVISRTAAVEGVDVGVFMAGVLREERKAAHRTMDREAQDASLPSTAVAGSNSEFQALGAVVN